ncbi:hypothetical protein [Bartonella harrusi]|uniref:Uncharacterized protein n=1 Tax=Bartonella harrusi TaxID=2961895 RepID=A0ABY5ES02_9HYPH|nr:hypothetical protein [Bartonella harrusi]UTO28171.1 hypothetical protein NMK50_08355 [Bartonella harrusi]
MSAVSFICAYKGAGGIAVVWGLFLLVLVVFALWELSLFWLIRGRQDAVILRCLWFLKWERFVALLAVSFICAYKGAGGYRCCVGIVLAGIGGVCIVGTVLVLAYQRAAGCGDIALLMVLEMGAFCCIVGGIFHLCV